MSFLAPELLWSLLALPVMPAAYLWLLQRRRKLAVAYSTLAVVRAAAAGRQWRRHVPPLLLFLALALLLLAAARPLAQVTLPWTRTTVILAMDVSLSMRVSDVQPNRLAAAQEAAKLFLQELPRHVEVGLVTFAGSSQVAQRATLDRAALVAAIDGFQMQRGTAIGSAIVHSLSELFPEHGLDVGAMTFGSSRPQGRSLDEAGKAPPPPFTPVPPGSYTSAAIILLSDGRRTTGVDTLDAARLAAERGVRIDVVGLGTPDGAATTPEGLPIYMQLDEGTLKEVARITGGSYHHAGSADRLREVYGQLGSRVQVQSRETEVSALLALAAAVLAVAAGVLSLAWLRRLD